MYQIKELRFGHYLQYQFTDTDTGNGFSIVPEAGGTIIDIWINGQSILDGYKTPEELTLAKWGKSAILFPFPNRLRDGHYHWLGKDYHFPLNNAATSNAIHGFARTNAFEMVDTFADERVARCSIRQTYNGHLAYYPFPCALELTFSIDNNGVFTTEVRVENHHHTDIPVGFGWHPYFHMTSGVEDTIMIIPVCEKVEIDNRMIPTGMTEVFHAFATGQAIGETSLDNAFLMDKDYELILVGHGRQLTMKADAATFPYFQVFTPPFRTSVALEPMSCNINAFNNANGLVCLAPAAAWKGQFTISVS